MRIVRFVKIVAVAFGTALALYGCGGGGGGKSAAPTPSDSVAFTNGASMSLIPAGRGNYQIQGSGFQNILGISIVIDYPTARMSSPAITVGNFFTQAISFSNVSTAGVARLAIVGTTPVSGTGTIGSIRFANFSGTRGPTFGSVTLADSLFRQYSTHGLGPQP
ncbi:hypothetical protein GMLC_07410 [Geomonas limicola]|uniref:Lipoprotein n=1 Tax=Geomonas limicola TaxID=2740186 RepID=A0A6V8N3P1_9BACT|nr:hypothetical protein [Geomonas limicola]GFO67162.1 hypothetical protein GMLC_07410 [Geomonas limicola]